MELQQLGCLNKTFIMITPVGMPTQMVNFTRPTLDKELEAINYF